MWATAMLQWNPVIPSSSTSLARFQVSGFTPFVACRSSSFSAAYPEEEEEEEEEEQVIGDCLVFEDGVFEEPFAKPAQKSLSVSSSGSLVPEEWGHVVDEINMPKPQRRKLAQQSQFGLRILNSHKAKSLNPQEYERFKDNKLRQLKPVHLDNPTAFPSVSSSPSPSPSSSSRVPPQNPRWAVYGRGLDDISDFFNSPTYEPHSHSQGLSGRVKLFSKEEKLLYNSRTPNLAIASSLKWLPLHALAASGQFYLLNSLLQIHFDINATDHDGLTALHKAILSKKQAITNYLLTHSADSLVRDKDGATLMHYAVQTASSQAIKTLVLHDVDINLQDNDGWTPLHLAVQARRPDVVRLLLIKGADKTLKNKDGVTPLELCLHFGRDSKTYELIKLLKLLPRQGR